MAESVEGTRKISIIRDPRQSLDLRATFVHKFSRSSWPFVAVETTDDKAQEFQQLDLASWPTVAFTELSEDAGGRLKLSLVRNPDRNGA